jgi:hypothetical protein
MSLAVLLAGCGSSTDSTSTNSVSSFSGKAADGYLTGALVCLDLNNNPSCDSDEPFDITGEGGVYQFDDLEASIDLSKVRLLVKVIAGQTYDENNSVVAVSRSYNMSSPPGQTDFVSPITTLIDNQMQSNLGQTQADAEIAVATILGITEDNIDLTEDYVALKESGDSALEYQRLHHVPKPLQVQ